MVAKVQGPQKPPSPKLRHEQQQQQKSKTSKDQSILKIRKSPYSWNLGTQWKQAIKFF